jgi:hypothetical protein
MTLLILFPKSFRLKLQQYQSHISTTFEAHDTILGRSTMLQTQRSWFWFPMRFFVALGSTHLQQKWISGIFLRVKGSCNIRITTSLPSLSWLSRNCRNLNISRSYWPPWLVTGIASPSTITSWPLTSNSHPIYMQMRLIQDIVLNLLTAPSSDNSYNIYWLQIPYNPT